MKSEPDSGLPKVEEYEDDPAAMLLNESIKEQDSKIAFKDKMCKII